MSPRKTYGSEWNGNKIMDRIGAALLCLSILFIAESHHHEIHHQMSSDEVKHVFGTIHTDVPEYTLVDVSVSNIAKRSTEPQRVVRINDGRKKRTIALDPSDGFLVGEYTPMTWALESNGYVEYQESLGALNVAWKILESRAAGASFIVSENRFKREVIDGYIALEHLAIRSLPDELCESLANNGSSCHVMFKPPESLSPPRITEILPNVNESRTLLSRKQRNAPHTVYPEIMLVLDSTMIPHTKSISSLVLMYPLIVWNAVDLRYRSMTNPRIRLNIAHIIIAASAEATPYIAENMITSNTVDAEGAARDASAHFHGRWTTFPWDSYDAIAIMTRHTLMYRGERIEGISTRKGACMAGFLRANPVALAHDTGRFNALTLAHEIGHILGAGHEDPSCVTDKSYIMSDDDEPGLTNWHFASCSIRDIRNFLSSYQARCLYNRPQPRGRIWPLLFAHRSFEQQCQRIRNTSTCVDNSYAKGQECQALFCIDRESGECDRLYENPIEGTKCGNGTEICVKGQCIKP